MQANIEARIKFNVPDFHNGVPRSGMGPLLEQCGLFSAVEKHFADFYVQMSRFRKFTGFAEVTMIALGNFLKNLVYKILKNARM